MLKQVLLVFLVFLVFVMMGVAIFVITMNVEWFYPFEDVHHLKSDERQAWPVTEAKGKRFRVQMPTLAQHTEDLLQGVRYELYTSFPARGQRYVVVVVHLPEDLNVADPLSIMEAEMNNLLDGYPPDALNDYQTLTVEGHPGLSFRIGDEVACRFIVVGRTMYQLMMKVESGKVPEEDYLFFLRSFELAY